LIRKEHVNVVMEFSRCARRPRRRPAEGRDTPMGARSLKAQQRAAGPLLRGGARRHVNEVDVVLGELDHRTASGRSPRHQRVERPPE
jgi:hypothetical protein